MTYKFLPLLLLLAATTTVQAQDKMEVKDAESNLLMQVNDEGAAGSLTLPGLAAVPVVFTDKLYSIGGELYFNGVKLGSGGGSDNLGNHTATQNLQLGSHWLSGDGDAEGVFVDGNGHVGIGTTNPSEVFEVMVDQSANGFGGMRIENVNPTANSERTVLLDLVNNDASSGRTYRLQNIGNATDRSGNFEIFSAGKTRFSITPNGNVGIGTGTPAASLDVRGDDGLLFGGTFGTGTLTASGAGTRLMWYPGKAAFRAGTVNSNQWDDANIGLFSVALGAGNTASRDGATVSGGQDNTASGQFTTIAGGYLNIASGHIATVAGGFFNNAGGDYSFAAGRLAKIDAAHDGTFLFSDQNNIEFHSAAANEFAARATGGVRFVTSIDGSGNPTAGVRLAPNGSAWTDLNGNPVGGDNMGNHTATQNLQLDGNWLSHDGDAEGILIDNTGGVLLGGAFGTGTLAASGVGTRLLWYPGKAAFRAGYVDGDHWNDANIGDYSVALGYASTASEQYTTVGGGQRNTASADYATVAGGRLNSAEAPHGTVAGGRNNGAYSENATVGGGSYNAAEGVGSTIAGGTLNRVAGDYSFATGHSAIIDAAHDGTFLFSDQEGSEFHSAAANEFAARATGGVRFVTSIDGSGNPNAGVRLAPDGSAWTDLDGNPIGVGDDLGNHTATQALDLGGHDITNAGTVNATAFVGDGSGLTGTPGDNLGSHIATQPLNLNGNDLSNGGTVTASAFVGDGSGLTGIAGDNLGNHTAAQTLNLNGNTISNAGSLVVNGTVQIKGGSPLRGRVLTSDDLGNATWQEHIVPQPLYAKFRDVTSFSLDDNWQDITPSTQVGNPLHVRQQIYKLEGSITARLTGGSGIDFFEIRVEANCNGITSYSDVHTFQPQEDENHDNFQEIGYLDYIDAPCLSGNISFRLQARNTGDDAWEARNRVLFVTGY